MRASCDARCTVGASRPLNTRTTHQVPRHARPVMIIALSCALSDVPTDAALLRAALSPVYWLIAKLQRLIGRIADALRTYLGKMPSEPDAPVISPAVQHVSFGRVEGRKQQLRTPACRRARRVAAPA